MSCLLFLTCLYYWDLTPAHIIMHSWTIELGYLHWPAYHKDTHFYLLSFIGYCHLQNTWHSCIDMSFCAHFGFKLQSIVFPQWLCQSLQTLMKIEVLDSAQVTQAKTVWFDRHFVISVSWCCHQALWISVYKQDFCSTNGSFNYHNIWSINILTMKLEWRTAVQQPWGYLKCSVWKCTSYAQFQHWNSELLLIDGVHSGIHYIGFKIYGITYQKVKNKWQLTFPIALNSVRIYRIWCWLTSV